MKASLGKIIFISISFFAFIFCTLGIVSSFIFGESLQQMLNSILHLRIYEPYVGGKIVSSIFDPMYDDTGSGTLVYPSHTTFAEGNLDLVLYTVHEPVFNAAWQDFNEYWQLDFEFRTGFKNADEPNYNKSIYVYIHLDGKIGGETKTLFEQAENISFSQDHPWHYALSIAGKEAAIFNSNREKIDLAEVVYSSDGKKIIVRIPLRKKELHCLYTVETMHHYVLVGAYSALDFGNILPIEKRKSRTSGGGLVSRFAPKVYDVLYEKDQSQMLSSWNEDDFELSILYPVKINMKNVQSRTPLISQAKIKEIKDEKKLLEALLYKQQSERIQNLKNASLDSELNERALLFLHTGNKKEAENQFKMLLEKDPNNPSYLAYIGSLESMKGENAAVIAAVDAVNKGYAYLDKAIQLTDGVLEKLKNGEASEAELLHRLNALLNRGGNSQAVPNSVFLKAAQGVQDYLEAAEIAHISGLQILEAQCYWDAAICLLLDDKKSEAGIWKREAARIFQQISESDLENYSLEERQEFLSLYLHLFEEGLAE
ncbi:MAG: glucodextranase DOMON-like domain-containing protein [Spirochaetota bacterium]|jgi:hypothetical protein|nr:glucodextranase DOMON-like domain-containing protein [Spirochaetota bacterium]HBG36487.1 hypothetical protein [Treponema sp.]